MTEHTEQAAVFEWASLMSNRYPELQLLFAIPNAGKRSYGAAAWMRNEGLKKGIPDTMLAYPCPYDDHFHGLFIEMKTKRGKVSKEQQWWIDALNDAGYVAKICYSANEAIATICEYINVECPGINEP